MIERKYNSSMFHNNNTLCFLRYFDKNILTKYDKVAENLRLIFFRPTRMFHMPLLRLSTFICSFQDLMKS